MSQSFSISGHLQLSSNETTGTVAVLSAQNAVSAMTIVNTQGWFTLSDFTGPAPVNVYGFPGQQLTDDAIVAALAAKNGVYYHTIIDALTTDNVVVYLNGASSVVAAATASGSENTQSQVKSKLYGEAANVFLAGYSAEFIAHIAAGKVYHPESFVSAANAIGGTHQLVSNVVENLAQTAVTPMFGAAAASNEVIAPMAQEAGSAPLPTVPASANWACNDQTWLEVLNSEDGTYADSMSNVEKITDGLAATTNGALKAFTISEVAVSAAKSIGNGLLSAFGSQLFELVCSWIFGPSENPVSQALQQIAQQLQTIISNQVAMLSDLSAIMQELKIIEKNQILVQLAQPIATIQANAQTVYGYAQAQKITTSTVSTACNYITDPNTGVVWALQDIHNLITGASGSESLPQASYACNLKTGGVGPSQNFLSNENCFAKVQGLFHYYASIQTQGVQLVMQAYNYLQNKGISNDSTPMVTSAEASGFYNKWLIGGKPGGASKPNIEIQRDLYRSLYSPYYNNFLGYMTPLPDDMAVAFIPHVSGQTSPIYYSVNSSLLVLGLVSYAFRRWVPGTGAIPSQTTSYAKSWVLPSSLLPLFRYPSKAEFLSLIGKGVSGSGDYYTYLLEQGFTDDSAALNCKQYLGNVSLFCRDASPWDLYIIPNDILDHMPFDVNFQQAVPFGIPPHEQPYKYYIVHKETTLPLAVTLQGNSPGSIGTFSVSSILGDPLTDPAVWAATTNQVFGALCVIDAKPLP